jgi:hypothetical protein
MLPANGRNAGVMDGSAGDFPNRQNVTQLRPMACQLTDETQRRGLHPDLNLLYRFP